MSPLVWGFLGKVNWPNKDSTTEGVRKIIYHIRGTADLNS